MLGFGEVRRRGRRAPWSFSSVTRSGKELTVARFSPQSQAQAKLDDSYLVALAKQGSATAYDGIVRRYYGFDPVNQVISSEELQALVACLSTVLSELESRVLALYLDGYSYEQVGAKLGCEAKTVDNALQRVKRKVGAHLQSRNVPL